MGIWIADLWARPFGKLRSEALEPLMARSIKQINITGLDTVNEQIVRDVIEIKSGDEYSPANLKKAEDVLKKWGVFDAVSIDTNLTNEGAILDFKFREAQYVVAINIEGNYPYIETRIRKYLNLVPGDFLSQEKVAEQVERIKGFYNRQGFIDTDISVDQEELPDWGGTVLTFKIHRGKSLRVAEVNVTGNKVFPNGRFNTYINPYFQFSEKRLAESVRRLKALYQKHGYPKARIRVTDKNIDLQKGTVKLSLTVNEGPHVEVKFKGEFHASHRTLRQVITVMREGSIDEYEIERSADAIKEFLISRGFPEAAVQSTREERQDGSILIIFTIDAGREDRIHLMTFKDTKGISKSDLTKEMVNREKGFGISGAFRPDEITGDDEAIKKALRKHGYLDSTIGEWIARRSPSGYSIDLTIPIELGTQTMVREVSFSGNSAFTTVHLLKELKIIPGKPIDEPELEDDRMRLVQFYGDNGFPYVDIKQSFEIDKDTGKAVIGYTISEGAKTKIGRILIIGDVLTSQKAIKNAMDIHEGETFSFKKVADSQVNIRRLGPFSSVSIETLGLAEKESTVHLKIKVEEQRPFQLDMGFGYSTDEKLTGSLSFTNINAFGWAKSNYLKLTGGQKLSRAELGWFDPRFLSSSFEMTTIGWVQYKERPSYAFAQTGASIGWFRRLRRFGLFFRYELNRNYFVKGDSVAADADSLRNNTISRISLSSSFDSRDSFSDPKRGFYTLGGVDIFNEIKGNDANFFKFQWQGENDETLYDRITLSTALRFNRIETIGKNVSVPTNELYFLGGDDTIRGFGEDSLGPQDATGKAVGGRTRWILNEELRLRLWRTLSFAFFFDMGSLTDAFSAINWNTIRRSCGLGIRYITPVGPIRLDYGFKLDRKTGESVGRLHFTFGYVF